MDLKVDVEDDLIYLEGSAFLVALSKAQARQLAKWLELAASKVSEMSRHPPKFRGDANI